ncbi:MAG TPA: energy-coupling factor transporter transmembrane protein EcfT [Gordonia sp. (in: high G+C Gram-positive bacteria)]|uniref:energy-coupling factor transporter transmembrane component T family protein n=1 Tax=unclassified Gordonia (in: high G+C Gram-positive bacteria) TaxID=2657482 RepID=UPI000F939C24|nr:MULTISPECIES: energy-coupling factor transporter transmembrane protein EcfT [unclassified Gordonia (in: high G+C Gram-positive bacteria)]RUP40724.1 MAG: energy-coupling factor transporter transmembrane protein EcfT [Gordonia sp. (in: high G+C Gram-positive bacteria)]HNP58349.1 energy-coupling factor transporter transmembrane protein EcfT [Gordonia sp. (in: high G+C Gram-positive bacteria)]HRC52742.1 energy-coupling factor transporter transmembrane protein EcfT [Gordonia sp. (in: high G+C Gram
MKGLPLREIPGDSVIHRLWAGTKLIAIGLIGILMWVLPSWPALGVVAAVVLVVALLAGIPLGAVPRPPWWFWALAAASVALSTLVAGPAGGLVTARSVLLGLLVIAVSVLVVWTTRASQLAPAIATLMRPLRWFRLPVDEWAVVIALCLRSLPLMIDELMILRAVHRLRPRAPAKAGHPSSQLTIVDMVVAALSSALRRSAEMGEAITARGGTGRLTAEVARPGRIDYVALAIMAVVLAAAIAGSFLIKGAM